MFSLTEDVVPKCGTIMVSSRCSYPGAEFEHSYVANTGFREGFWAAGKMHLRHWKALRFLTLLLFGP